MWDKSNDTGANLVRHIRLICVSIGGFISGFFVNLRCAHQIYMTFGEKILVLKFELPRISIMPREGGPKN